MGKKEFYGSYTISPKLKISVILFFFGLALFSWTEEYFPVIQEINSKDPLFTQYVQDVEKSYMALAQKKTISVQIYQYEAKKNDTLLSVAARCNLPYETLAGINSLPGIDAGIAGKTLYLPTVPGLFITAKPQTSLEYLLLKKTFDLKEPLWYTIKENKFYFLPGERLSSTERAFFLDTALRSPLPQGILTSSYGLRTSPISGKEHFHGGVDLAAPMGTPVLAARAGSVIQTGFDAVYGNFIIVRHENNTESLYAHLQSVLIKKSDSVNRGAKIGIVGSTGASTGPHLHFEMRTDGQTQNINYLFTGKK